MNNNEKKISIILIIAMMMKQLLILTRNSFHFKRTVLLGALPKLQFKQSNRALSEILYYVVATAPPEKKYKIPL